MAGHVGRDLSYRRRSDFDDLRARRTQECGRRLRSWNKANCLRRNKFSASAALRDLHVRAISPTQSKSTRYTVRIKCRNAFNQSTKRHMNVQDRTAESPRHDYCLRVARSTAGLPGKPRHNGWRRWLHETQIEFLRTTGVAIQKRGGLIELHLQSVDDVVQVNSRGHRSETIILPASSSSPTFPYG
jgi:hypothetical protein